jgi:hypothetical protein
MVELEEEEPEKVMILFFLRFSIQYYMFDIAQWWI